MTRRQKKKNEAIFACRDCLNSPSAIASLAAESINLLFNRLHRDSARQTPSNVSRCSCVNEVKPMAEHRLSTARSCHHSIAVQSTDVLCCTGVMLLRYPVSIPVLTGYWYTRLIAWFLMFLIAWFGIWIFGSSDLHLLTWNGKIGINAAIIRDRVTRPSVRQTTNDTSLIKLKDTPMCALKHFIVYIEIGPITSFCMCLI